ncbi:MAG: acetaldehyde dehydrogenase/alcohol dehydrogenase, partial [Psychromonas sp.]|uniref:aldehyde dehydrogenase family protein n=1 Tax=Psychromonas sp. TaxID=1884585 RepID=UPI0039E43AF1
MTVSTVAELEALIARVKVAQAEYATFSQEKVDEIFRVAALKVSTHRIELAKMAVEETGMGIMEDKVIKNHFASEFIYNSYADTKTVGELSRNNSLNTVTLAEPMGIICAIIPTTNPTSTAIFKTLMALKTGNGCIVAPHPRAKKCTNYAAQLVLEAAVSAGAPKDIIGWIDTPSLELTNTIMKHDDTAIILATGGPGMVKAAYSSGNPAIGVGAGNTPVVIDESADIKRAVSSILMSKTFDNGMICASEQAVIVVESKYEEFKARLDEYGAVI